MPLATLQILAGTPTPSPMEKPSAPSPKKEPPMYFAEMRHLRHRVSSQDAQNPWPSISAATLRLGDTMVESRESLGSSKTSLASSPDMKVVTPKKSSETLFLNLSQAAVPPAADVKPANKTWVDLEPRRHARDVSPAGSVAWA